MLSRTLRGPLLLSVCAAVSTMGLKSAAYFVTGSVGLLSDALESGVNLLAALVAYFSLLYAGRPADAEHTFGHEKIEFFSSGLEGILVLVAGLGTIGVAVNHLIHPHSLDDLGFGIGLAVLASAINLAVAMLLLKVGKKHGSIVLEADGHHLMSDVVATVGVVIGLGFVMLTKIPEIDSLVAILVGLHILRIGFQLIRRSYDGLMDRALPAAEITILREAIRAALPAGADFHHLRTRRAGRRKFADFHLLLDGSLSVRDAHAVAHEVDTKLKRTMAELEITLHVEPIEDGASWEPDALLRLGETPTPAVKHSGMAPPIDD